MTSSVGLGASLIFLAFLFSSCSSAQSTTYNVLSYRAKPDGTTDSTKAFLAAWTDACGGSAEPSTVLVPKGRFSLGSVVFDGSKCKGKATTVRIDGTLVAPSDYEVIGNEEYWVFFEHVDGVSVFGGVLDAKGADLWACKNSDKKCPRGATTIGFQNSRNVMVSGMTSVNSQMFHMVINSCENVTLQGVKVVAPGNSPNTDGIHVQSSSSVAILNSHIGTGDDCISIGPGTSALSIESVACGPGHGISIGSLGKDAIEKGVQDVTVRSATFTGTQNGVRIKAWARPSTGFARDILFQHCIMNNVQNPIVINQSYCPGSANCPGKMSGVRISNVTFVDIHGTSASEVGVTVNCSPQSPCTGIRLEDVKLTYQNQPAGASCSNAGGTEAGFLKSDDCL